MPLPDQDVSQFVFATFSATAWTALNCALLFDYRGFLGWYAHATWWIYQRAWFQAFFRRTHLPRSFTSDEGRLRRATRLLAGVGLVVSLSSLAVELATVATGHVSR